MFTASGGLLQHVPRRPAATSAAGTPDDTNHSGESAGEGGAASRAFWVSWTSACCDGLPAAADGLPGLVSTVCSCDTIR